MKTVMVCHTQYCYQNSETRIKFRNPLCSPRWRRTACAKITIRNGSGEIEPVADLNFDIWRMQAQGDVRGLINLLRHPSPEMRRRVATALRAVGATTAIPALQTAL